ncbi:hypothetical protein PAHAL_5G387900 [Panicum hallii]|uniref:Uncharacterized protein n=1 Tax=Panicum hallii TaxID=206008 RepID=A0A2T8IMN2_9POAL|nr:hypothetical protein PAHAL_5G387900 [Panicum hallii]
MWGVEDPLPKSKRRQRMEQIWAQNNSINSQGAVVEASDGGFKTTKENMAAAMSCDSMGKSNNLMMGEYT